MGIVFQWDQVKNREIPTTKNIIEIVNETKNRLAGERDVLAGVVYGSFIHNALSRRSDVDVMVVYRTGSKRIRNAVSDVQHIALHKNVALELSTISEADAATRLHDYGPLMLAHLHQAVSKQGAIKEDPCRWLCPKVGTAEEDVRGYLRHKRASFEDKLNYIAHLSEFEFYHMLRKVLEISAHVGRRMVALSDGVAAADSKRAVIERYPQIATPRAAELFEVLIAADDAYSEELVKQLAGSADETEEKRYRKAIISVRDHLPLALEFSRENIFMLESK